MEDGSVNVMILLSKRLSVEFQVMISTADVTAVGIGISNTCSYIVIILIFVL